jgi:AcrR family transcriptional regulator
MARAGLDTAIVTAAAAELADIDGLDQLTLARLARRLGVRSPSLYGYVDGLNDLRGRLAILGLERLNDVLAQAAAGRAGVDALRATALAYRDFALAHPGLYAAAQVVDAGDRSATAAAGRVVDVMRAVIRGYGLEGDDAVHAARTWRAAVHGFVTLQRDDGFAMATSVSESFDRMIAIIDRGLMTEGPTARHRLGTASLPDHGGDEWG